MSGPTRSSLTPPAVNKRPNNPAAGPPSEPPFPVVDRLFRGYCEKHGFTLSIFHFVRLAATLHCLLKAGWSLHVDEIDLYICGFQEFDKQYEALVEEAMMPGKERLSSYSGWFEKHRGSLRDKLGLAGVVMSAADLTALHAEQAAQFKQVRLEMTHICEIAGAEKAKEEERVK